MTNHGNSYWEIVIPASTTNLISNPSFETGTDGWETSHILWNSTEPLITTASLQFWGVYAMGACQGACSLVQLSPSTQYTLSVRLNGRETTGSYQARVVQLSDGTNVGSVTGSFVPNEWEEVEVTFTTDADTNHRVHFAYTQQSNACFLYIDGVQLEAGSAATTYADGDQPGCVWLGARHASQSKRDAQSRAGGEVINLNDDYDVIVRQQPGAGMPPVANIQADVGLQDGGLFQRTLAQPRQITLDGIISGSSVDDFHFKRQRLIDAIKPDLVTPVQPFLLRYTGRNNVTKQLAVHYDGGLESSQTIANIEAFSVRGIAYDPYFEEVGDQGAIIDGLQTLSSVNRIARRNPDGTWEKLGTGLDGTVYAIAYDGGDTIYARGDFANAGGVSACRITKWSLTGSSWSSIDGNGGVGFSFGSGGDVAIAPNGTLWASGLLSASGNIIYFDGTNWQVVTGSGTDGIVRSIAFDAGGDVYIGGGFTTAGSITACRVAKYDVSASSWYSLGDGFDDEVNEIVVMPNGTLYAIGEFTNTGSTSACRVAKFNTSSSLWEALGDGANGEVNSIAVSVNNFVYIGGDFTQVGGVSACRVACYNGSNWIALGTGIKSDLDQAVVHALAFDGNSNLYVGGADYDESAGGVVLGDNMALWNEAGWQSVNFDFALDATFYDILFTPDDTMFLAGAFTGNLSISGFEPVVNEGTATAFPIVEFKGAGGLREINNHTGGFYLYLNDADLNENETITFSPKSNSIISDTRGSILSSVLPGSNFSTWLLLPGSNSVTLYGDDASASALMRWKKRHWSFDGG